MARSVIAKDKEVKDPLIFTKDFSSTDTLRLGTVPATATVAFPERESCVFLKRGSKVSPNSPEEIATRSKVGVNKVMSNCLLAVI